MKGVYIMANAKKLPSGNWRVRVFCGKDENGTDIMKRAVESVKRKEERKSFDRPFDKKKKTWPMVLIIDLIFVIMILSQISWTSVFGIDLFTDITTAISNFKVGGFPIFAKIWGTRGAFEQWSLEHITVLLVFGAGL